MKSYPAKEKSSSFNASTHQRKSQSKVILPDNRKSSQTGLGQMANQGKHALQLKALEGLFNSSQSIQKQGVDEEELMQGKFETAQREGIEDEELLQGKFDTVQKMSLEEEEPLPGKFETAQREGIEEEELLQGKFETAQKQKNNTGLPDNLKSGIENLSGFSMDDVKVHYNSPKPATLQAHAYAQGTEIHIASGQEKHLPHEAWHVVQQKQGRVKPTLQMLERSGNPDSSGKGKVNINDDAGLEKEADVMGEGATRSPELSNKPRQITNNSSSSIIQGEFNYGKQATRIAAEEPEKGLLTEIVELGPVEASKSATSISNESAFGLQNWLPADTIARTNPNNAAAVSAIDATSTTPPTAATPAGQNVTNSTQAYNITSTIGGGFGLLYGIASGIDAFKNNGSFSDKMNAIFDTAANTSALVSGVTGVISDHTSGGVNTGATAASNGTWVADGAINAVKGAINMAKNIYYGYKRHTDANVKSDTTENIDRLIDILKGFMNTGAGIVKTVNNALSSFGGISIATTGIPILGLITSSFDIITRIIDIIRGGINKLEIRKEIIKIYPLKNLQSIRKEKKKIFSSKVDREKTREMNDRRKRKQDTSNDNASTIEYQFDTNAVNLGNKFAGTIEDQFDTNAVNLDNKFAGEIEEQFETNAVNFYTTEHQFTDDIFPDHVETYEYLREMDYINGKRQIRASVKIGVDLTNIAGEIATLTGVGATVGVPLKAVAASSGLLMDGFRKLKQWGRDKVDDKNYLFDNSKSSPQKKQKIINDVGFVFRNYSELKRMIDLKVEEEKIKAKEEKIKLYIEASGASYSHFNRKVVGSDNNEEGVKKAAEYLISEMKKRE